MAMTIGLGGQPLQPHARSPDPDPPQRGASAQQLQWLACCGRGLCVECISWESNPGHIDGNDVFYH